MSGSKAHYKTAAILALLWVLVTSANITKAVHIDDTAYLAIAEHIVEDPLHPMSGLLNWKSTSQPMHYTNQPVLLFYLYAITIALFGKSMIALHLTLSLFTMVCILLFYLLARTHAQRYALHLTALFVLGPVFIPSQNLMTDIPMTALWLGFFWALLTPTSEEKKAARYILAGIFAAAACLTKYASLILIPVLLFDIGLRREWRRLWVVGIPVLALVGWSLFNYFDYGGIHLLGRPTPPRTIAWLITGPIAWTIGLGALAPFSIISIPYLWRKSRFLLLEAFAFSLIVFLIAVMSLEEPLSFSILRSLFFGNGLIVAALTIQCLLQDLKKRWSLGSTEEARPYLILLTWFLGASAFFVLFAPFAAARHFLPVLPVAILVVGSHVAPVVKKQWLYAGLAATVSLGVVLGASDWVHADSYRIQAGEIARQLQSRQGGTIWYTGHLGWQWYARKTVMKQYDSVRTVLREGDLLVEPQLISHQELNPEHLRRLTVIDEIDVEPNPVTFFRLITKRPRGGYYNYTGFSLPWTLSSAPLEEFIIYRAGGNETRTSNQHPTR